MKHLLIVFLFFVALPVFAVDDDPKVKIGTEVPGTSGADRDGVIQDGVYFVNLKNGAQVSQTFKVKFGVHGMRVKPAGELEFGTGHHHLIINDEQVVKTKGVPKNSVVAKDETHIHFGQGQEETDLTLKPGKYSLTLQFADGAHMSYGPKWSKTIHIVVK